jgi:hypothetical protein
MYESCGFQTWWGEFFYLPNLSGSTKPWGSLSLLEKWVPEAGA